MAPNCTRLVMFVSQNGARVHHFGVAASRTNWRVIHAYSPENAIAMLGTHDGLALDVVLLNVADPTSLVHDIAARRPALPIVVESASVEVALDALREGATDYLLRPAPSERLLAALETALATSTLRELRPLSECIAQPLGFSEIVGTDPNFRAALAQAAKGARARAPMLIEGPSGVGKTMVARAVHSASSRDKKPFHLADAAQGSAAQLESDLFGHEKGAFPGAFDRRVGKAVQADGGTLLIKNVDQLTPDLQLKLLRLIEHGEVRPIGRAGALLVDVCVIATSMAPLITAAKAGSFREDLYYRLATVHATLPPLATRRGDIAMLTRHLLSRQTVLSVTPSIGISDPAVQLLSGYHWLGNVAQLQSSLLRASVSHSGELLTTEDFPVLSDQTRATLIPLHLPHHASGVSMFTSDGHLRPLAEIEADIIRLAIGHYRGRMSEVARRLGIGRSTLYRKLIELGLTEVA